VPIAPGVPPNIAADVLVLDYGNPQSLEVIKARKNWQPFWLYLQTGRPDLQPKTFLQQLRQLTKESGITLIFDEMVTGFRFIQAAQAWFGIEADIATYGKIVGGGMPIGIIAGTWMRSTAVCGIMRFILPQAKTTFFAGTFCKHPFMAAALAVLKHLKTQGATLQQQLNQRTSQFVAALNAYFEEDEVPVRMAHFGSLFGPASAENPASREFCCLRKYGLVTLSPARQGSSPPEEVVTYPQPIQMKILIT